MPQIFGAPTAGSDGGIMMGHQGMQLQPRLAQGLGTSPTAWKSWPAALNHDGLLSFRRLRRRTMPRLRHGNGASEYPQRLRFTSGSIPNPGIGPDGEDVEYCLHFSRRLVAEQAGACDDKTVHKIECRSVSRGRLLRRHVHGEHYEFGHLKRWACRCRMTPPCRAVSAAKEREIASTPAGQPVHLIEKNIRPRDIITRKSLENAYTMVLALGGSTNAVLHLKAIAHEAGVEWTLADFDRLGNKVPHLDGPQTRRTVRRWMNDLHRAGGSAAVLRGFYSRRRHDPRRLHDA